MSIRVMSAVWSDGPQGQGELLVLLALADFADDRGHCWPAMDSIARMSRMSERNVRRVIRKLEADGYVETTPSGGRTSNRYRVIPNPDNLSAQSQPGQSAQPGHLEHATRTISTVNPDICDTNPDTAVSAEPSRTIIEPSENRQDAREGFDAFWEACPKKVGKGAARKSYAAALRKADAATILAAMNAYAAERRGKDAQYTVHPATWLNQERWDDDTGPPPDDFHRKIDAMLKETMNHDLRRADEADTLACEQVPARLEAPGASDRRDGDAADARDRRGNQQAVAGLIQPRRFGGGMG